MLPVHVQNFIDSESAPSGAARDHLRTHGSTGRCPDGLRAAAGAAVLPLGDPHFPGRRVRPGPRVGPRREPGLGGARRAVPPPRHQRAQPGSGLPAGGERGGWTDHRYRHGRRQVMRLRAVLQAGLRHARRPGRTDRLGGRRAARPSAHPAWSHGACWWRGCHRPRRARRAAPRCRRPAPPRRRDRSSAPAGSRVPGSGLAMGLATDRGGPRSRDHRWMGPRGPGRRQLRSQLCRCRREHRRRFPELLVDHVPARDRGGRKPFGAHRRRVLAARRGARSATSSSRPAAPSWAPGAGSPGAATSATASPESRS